MTPTQNIQYDTPVGVGGKIDTSTGKIISGEMQGTQAQAYTPKNIVFNPPKSQVIKADTIGTTEYKLPTGNTTYSPPITTVPPPTSTDTKTTQTDSSAPTDSRWSKFLSSMGIQEDIEQYSNRGAETLKAQEEQQVAQKRDAATASYSAYQAAKVEQAQTIERMRTENPAGVFGGAQQQMIDSYRMKSDAHLANLAVKAQADQGLLTAAEQSVKDKISAQFDPIKDKITMMAQFAQLYQNDMSESESMQMQALINQKTREEEFVRSTSDAVHKAVLESGGDLSVYSEFDNITQDYAAGKITAEQAQSKYYAAAGPYGAKKTAATVNAGLPMSILDVARYNELYPDAGVVAGDTEAQANMKVAASNSPEAKLRSQIAGYQSSGETYEKVVADINGSTTIKDKKLALAVANDVYGRSDGPVAADSPIEKEIAYRKKSGNLTDADIRSALLKRYTKQEVAASSVGSVLDKIEQYLFAK